MHRKREIKLMLSILSILAMGLTVDAWAGGLPRHSRGGPDGGPGPGAPPHGFAHFSRLAERLIYPCRDDCVEAQHTCTETAEAAALTCAEQTCGTTVDAARADCATERRSQACQDAVSALQTCIQPCIDSQSSAVTSCLDTFQACLGACIPTPTPTP